MRKKLITRVKHCFTPDKNFNYEGKIAFTPDKNRDYEGGQPFTPDKNFRIDREKPPKKSNQPPTGGFLYVRLKEHKDPPYRSLNK